MANSNNNNGRRSGKGGQPFRQSKKYNQKGKKYKDDKRDDIRDPIERRPSSGDRLSSLNDESWYTRYPDLVEGAARISFPYRPGRVINGGGQTTYPIPGVAVLNWVPNLGVSTDNQSPLSQVAKELQSR